MIVFDDPFAHRRMRGLLVGNGQRRVDAEAACVGFFLEAVEHDLADHFRKMICFYRVFVHVLLDRQHLFVGGLPLVVADEIEFTHAPQHILLSQFGAFRVHHRVKAGRRFWQPREHGHFSQRDLL